MAVTPAPTKATGEEAVAKLERRRQEIKAGAGWGRARARVQCGVVGWVLVAAIKVGTRCMHMVDV